MILISNRPITIRAKRVLRIKVALMLRQMAGFHSNVSVSK